MYIQFATALVEDCKIALTSLPWAHCNLDREKDEIIHHCKVIRYDPEEENIYLIAGKSDITSFLLDGVYRCTINSEKKEIWCQGVIRERYCNKVGKVLVFRVQNGFYEKNINKIK